MKEKSQTSIDSISLINYSLKNLYQQLFRFSKIYKLNYTFHQENYQYIYKFYYKKVFLFKHISGRTPQNEDYDIIEFNGMKSYNKKEDDLREEYLYKVLSHIHLFNDNLDRWNIRRLDLSLDIQEEMNKILIHKRGKSKKHPIRVHNKSFYRTEEIPKSGRKTMKMTGVLYNKLYKEICFHNNIIDDYKSLSRFEISLLPKLMKNIHFVSDLKRYIDKYDVYLYKSSSECKNDKVLLNSMDRSTKLFKFKNYQSQIIHFNLEGVIQELKNIDRFIDIEYYYN